MRRYGVVFAAAAVTAALTMTGASSASAATEVKSCTTSDGGALGAMIWNWKSRKEIAVQQTVVDKAADSAYVRVRLDITTGKGDRYDYPWHNNRDGKGKSKSFPGTATHKDGIVSARIQVEDVRGSSPLATCCSGKTYNPYY
ncbi:hypothetical protein [Streptomyces sp. NPDC048191]|uniref:hypothetical protein n=1 Tax=Streptomyces sp. NPDC048191 TaxID=3155484 RepID=UPI0033FA4970